MSQINTTAELVLRNERFLAVLRATEAETRAAVARMSALSASVPVNPQQHMNRAVGSIADETMRRSGINPAAMNEAMANVRTAGIEFRQGVGMFREFVDDFGATVAEMRQGIAQGNANAASAGAPGAPTPTAPMGRTGAPGGRGMYMLSHLVGYYGVRSLLDTIGRRHDSDDRWSEGGDPVELARKDYQDAKENNSGLLGWMRRRSAAWSFRIGNQQFGADDPEEAERVAGQGLRSAERVKKTTELQTRAMNEQRDIDAKTAAAIGGNIKARSAALDNWLEDQEKLAADLSRRGKGTQSQRLQQSARAYVDIEKAVMAQEQGAADQASQTAIDEFGTRSSLAAMRGAGQGRQAGYLGRRAAVFQGLRKMRDAVSAETDPVKARRLWNQYLAAQGAAVNELGAIDHDEFEGRLDDTIGTRNTIGDTRFRGYVARLRAGGDPRLAAIEERRRGVDNRIRDAQDAYDREQDPVRKRQLGQILAEAKSTGTDEKAAIDADERRRQENAITEMVVAAHRARLREARDDYRAETKVWNEEWDQRIKKLRESGATAAEVRAANEQRAAESRARDKENTLRNLREWDEGAFSRLRATGERGAGVADVMELRVAEHEELRAAGGDPARINAIKYKYGGRAQEMARRLMPPPRIDSSFRNYLGYVQGQVLGGTGRIFDMLQVFNHAQGGIRSGSTAMSDLEKGTKKLDEAADKLLKSKELFILKD